MGHKRVRITRRRVIFEVGASVATVVLVAACGGASPAPTSVPAAPASAATPATPAAAAPTVAAATATARPAAAPSPTPAPAADTSAGAQVLRRPTIEPMNFDLGLIGGGVPIEMANFMFSGLTEFDWEQRKVIPAAAESWDVSDDKLTYTFHLRRGMVWSDGTPVTAHDYEYAIKRNLDPALGGPLTVYVYPLKGAEDYNKKAVPDATAVGVSAKDDFTVVTSLVGPTPYWPAILSLWITMPINKKSIDKGGAKWMEPENIISNGRYTMQSWTHDQKMVLVRNDKYYGNKPAIDRIEYVLYQNPNTQGMTAFQAGEVDEAVVLATNADFVASDPKLSKLRRQVPVSGTWQLRIDMSNAKSALSNVNVRKALYLGIDRELLCKQVLKGLNTPALILTPPDIPSYDPSGALPGGIPEAKKFLADAGFADGTGFPGFKLGFVSTQATAKLVAEALVQMWKDNLGITSASAFVVPTDWRQRIKTEPFDMYVGDWQSDYPDPQDWHNVIFSGDSWQSHWKDETYLTMIKTANVEPNLDKRNQMYAAAEAYMIKDQMATIPLYLDGQLWVVQPWLQGLKVSPFNVYNVVDGATIAKH